LTVTDRSQVALQVGHQVHWYEIRAVVGQGGFGITYLARDANLDHLVAIKEYLPPNLAVRSGESTVRPMSEGRSSIFDWGLERFVREARTLAKFKHPNIVTVFSVFEANGTAYMVMEYERGVNLEQAIDAGLALAEAELLGIVHPLLDGLELVHGGGFIHRDIKPENILLRKDGSPVLLDFGSARESLIGESPTLTTLVTPGYAPFEQYQDDRHSSKQGPWSDIYSLGATLYRVITGEGPVDALTRVNSRLDKTPDPLRPAGEVAAGRFSDQFLRAVDAALHFDVRDRPQDVAQWRRMFPQGGQLPDMQGISDASLAWAEWESRKPGKPSGALTGLHSEGGETRRIDHRRVPRFVWIGAIAAVVVGGIALGNLVLNRPVPERPAITKIVAVPPDSSREDEIGELLRAAAADVEALHLTTPVGDNAFERYQQVLTMESGNEDAKRGLEVIVIRYVTLANTALSKGELDKAEQYLDSATGVLPDDDGIALARNMLAAARSSSPLAASGSAPRSAAAVATPVRVALLPFWGRQSAAAAEDGPDISVEISEFVHDFLRSRSSLDMIYSYYQPGFDHADVKGAGELWSGDAVRKVPQLDTIRELGRSLDADGVLLYGYEHKPGTGAHVQAYLVDVGDGRVIRRDGALTDLAEITRGAFDDWTGGGD
jgi:serine/threonine protein kinase